MLFLNALFFVCLHFVGSYEDARDRKKLEELGITHVLNCAAWNNKNPYIDHPTIARYKQFFAEDSHDYDMLQHFRDAQAFIEEARRWRGSSGNSGKVLVHCALGVNRSGLMVAAYLMCERRSTPADAVRTLKLRRGMVLTNPSFQRQLIQLARDRRLLPYK